MEKDFLIVTPDTGSNDGALNIECTENTDRNPRSSVITVIGNGLASKTINVTQRGDRTTIVSVLGHTTQGYSPIRLTRFEAKNTNTYWSYFSNSSKVLITFPPNAGAITWYDENTQQGLTNDIFIFLTKNDIPSAIQNESKVVNFIDPETNDVLYTPNRFYTVYLNRVGTPAGYNSVYISPENTMGIGDEDLMNINEKLNNKNRWGIVLNNGILLDIENVTYNALNEVPL